jgi:hypothetical protein
MYTLLYNNKPVFQSERLSVVKALGTTLNKVLWETKSVIHRHGQPSMNFPDIESLIAWLLDPDTYGTSEATCADKYQHQILRLFVDLTGESFANGFNVQHNPFSVAVPCREYSY